MTSHLTACVEQLKLNISHVVIRTPSEDRKYKKDACKINQLFYKLSFGVLRCFQKVTDSNDISESFCNGLADAWQALHNTWQKRGDTQGGTRLPLIDAGPYLCAHAPTLCAFVLH